MISVKHALLTALTDLDSLNVQYAVIGGLAVNARIEPRMTRNVDLVVSVVDDAGTEQVLFKLQQLGYIVDSVIEQTAADRLATARLLRQDQGGVIVDRLFASSGIVDAGGRLHHRPTGHQRRNRSEHQAAHSILAPNNGEKIIELGFGTGHLLRMLSRTPGLTLAGVDPSELMVETAQRRLAGQLNTELDLRVGTAESLPWKAGTFDKAAALHFFQFWDEPIPALREIRRVMMAGGHFVLILRDHNGHSPAWVPNPLSHRPDEVSAAEEALKLAGFVEVKQETFQCKSPILSACVDD